MREFTIQAAPITVRIRDVRCSIRDTDPTFRYDITSGSLAPGDSLGSPRYSVYSKTGYSYGPYFGIRAEFPVNPNYAITVREGTMTYYDVKVDDDVISTDFRVAVNDVYYNGTYQEPTVKVYDRYNNRLTEGEDYTLSFSNNRQVGTATVFVTGINSYRGSYATEHFEILSNHSKPTNDRYTIDASASDGGRISPSGTNTVRDGADKTFNFYANSGYEIIGVYVDNEYVGTKSSYTFRDVSEDHEIYVEFAKRNSSNSRYDITIRSSYGGTVTPNDSGSVTVARGNSRTFYFEPDAGYRISAVYVDGSLVSTRNNQYTFTNVRDDHRLDVEFTRINGYWDNAGNWYPGGPNHDWTPGWKNPYYDVSNSAWYYNELCYMTSRGIVNGVSNDVFSPEHARFSR